MFDAREPIPGDIGATNAAAEFDDAAIRGLAEEQDVDLRESLAALSQLSMGYGGLPSMLVHVAEFAVRAIPGADGVGVMVVHQDRPDTVVASADFVDSVDAIQYGLGEGPCITAAADASTVVSVRCARTGDGPGSGRARACSASTACSRFRF